MVPSKALIVERCFKDPPIGCFSIQYPFTNTWRLPFSPAFIDIHYEHIIFQDKARFNWRDAVIVMEKRFQPSLKTVVIVHGFTENGTSSWVQNMTFELAKLSEPINILILDWNRGADLLSYSQVVANGRVVAAMGAMFLKNLIALGANPASFHIIGNSVGAHIAGDLASRIPGTGRVTGLDPCRWSYVRFPPEVRLDSTDAIVVDVIHTDGGRRLISSGTMVPLGTIDFYVNGGKDQPGCKDTLWHSILDMLGIKETTKCSHGRARKLFTESINHCNIMATKCSSLYEIIEDKCCNCSDGQSCIKFGYHLHSNVTGLHAFKTGDKSPFC